MLMAGRLDAAVVSPGAALPVIDTTSRFFSLTAEQTESGYPVRLEGVVLYSDPVWGMIWIQDETGIIYQSTPRKQVLPPARTRVVATGRTAMQGSGPVIANLEFRTIGPAELPAPVLLTVEKLKAGVVAGQRTFFGGKVMDAEIVDEDHLRLTVAFQRAYQVRVYVMGAAVTQPDALIGGQVELTGVLTYPSGDLEPGFAPVQMFVPELQDMSILRRGLDNPFDAPRLDLAELRSEYENSLEARLVRVRGKALSIQSTNLVVPGAGTNRVQVRLRRDLAVNTNTHYEAAGFVWSGSEGELLLDRAILRTTTAIAPATKADKTLPTVKTVQAIRGMKPSVAARGYPVDVIGVVTYHDRKWRLTFVQDGTGGIYVDARTKSHDLVLGDRVRVRGYTDPGGFAPMVAGGELEKIGTAEVPAPRHVAFGRLMSGAYDCQWIQLEGVVESVTAVQHNLRLQVRHPGGGFQAVLVNGGATSQTTNWVGSEVRLTGVCGVRANALHQVTGISLNVPGWDQVEFLRQVSGDPYAIPKTELDGLLRHHPESERTEQIRVSGVVTYANSAGLTAIQDGSHGLFVRFATNNIPPLATRIDALGFPVADAVAPTLRQARWRQVADAEPPAATSLDLARVHTADSVGCLVTVDATVLENHLAEAVPTLTLRFAGEVFSADFSALKKEALPGEIAEGTGVRVRGVHRLMVNEWDSTRHFRLLVPPGAVPEIISQPPWLTTESASMAALCVGFVALLITSWNLSLRSRVRRQSDLIRTEMEDKNRITAEYDELVRNADEMIVLMDDLGVVLSLNPAAERVLGCTTAALRGTPLSEQLDPASVSQLRLILAGLKAEQPSAVTDLHLADQRKPVSLEASFRLTQVPGEGAHVHCIARDVTERRHLETQVRQMQKMESVGQLAAGVAHDYNNLMTVVIGNAEFLLEDEELGSEGNVMVREIHEAADRASSLTRQLLAFSRRQMIRLKKVEPGAMLRDLGKMLERLLGETVTLKFDLPETLHSIRADRGMLEHVVINLAVNGRDAMNGTGTLTISAKPVSLSLAEADRHPDALPGDYLRISVADTGCGISEADLPRVFEPFFTTKDVGEGTGLGLSTVFGIAKQHEGWVEIETELGQGSTFHVYLPAWHDLDDRPADAPGKSAVKHSMNGKEHVLLVEDERGVRDTMMRVLTRAGYQVSVAVDGAEAMSVWREQGGQVDVLVTDMIMPGKVSGSDLAEQLRAECPDLRIVYCTGYSAELTGLSELRSTERLLPKPFENKQLLQVVRGLLDGSSDQG